MNCTAHIIFIAWRTSDSFEEGLKMLELGGEVKGAKLAGTAWDVAGARAFGKFCGRSSGSALGFLSSFTWDCKFSRDLSFNTTVSKLASRLAGCSYSDLNAASFLKLVLWEDLACDGFSIVAFERRLLAFLGVACLFPEALHVRISWWSGPRGKWIFCFAFLLN